MEQFSSTEEFELKAHECFGRIFALLMKVDGVVKKRADEEETEGQYGEMSDLRDWVEEVILQCHLAWQYHRLSKGPRSMDTWEHIENESTRHNPGD